jgi:hypothetical protein
MRYLSLLILLFVLAAVPLAAQSLPEYQPPTAGERAKLQKSPASGLKQLRAGQAPGRALTQSEREQLAERIVGKEHKQEFLRALKAGHFHAHFWADHWVVFVVVPSACGAVALTVFLVLLFL